MTDQELLRGEEITREITTLKHALSEVSNTRIFSIEANTCRREGDPFLSELNMEIKAMSVKKINGRIASLEKEFKAL